MIGLGRLIRRYTFLASRMGGIVIGLAVFGVLTRLRTLPVPWRDQPYEMDAFSAGLIAFVAYVIASRVISGVLARTVRRLRDVGGPTRGE